MLCSKTRMLVLGSVLMLLGACKAADSPVAPAAPASPASTTQGVSRTGTADFLRGYFESRDGGLFTVCGETSRRQVRAMDAATSAALVEANSSIDRPRFVMAAGNLRGRDALEIGRFEIISGDAFNCESRLEEIVVAARGSAVLWSLEVTRAAASFAPAPTALPVVYPFMSLQEVDGEQVLASGAGDARLTARLRQAACVEPLTDTTFGWSISVQADGMEFSGCAWHGLAVP